MADTIDKKLRVLWTLVLRSRMKKKTERFLLLTTNCEDLLLANPQGRTGLDHTSNGKKQQFIHCETFLHPAANLNAGARQRLEKVGHCRDTFSQGVQRPLFAGFSKIMILPRT